MAEEQASMELMDLNDDCLNYLFSFLDAKSMVAFSETCKRFNNIAEDQFHNCKYYDCEIIDDVEEAAKIIEKIGKHLRRLDLRFEDDEDCKRNHYEHNADEAFFSEGYGDGYGFIELLADCLRENLSFDTLHIKVLICFLPVELLTPAFARLKHLTIHNNCDNNYGHLDDIDLPALCPNLKSLKIIDNLFFTPNHEKIFKNLEILKIVNISSWRYLGIWSHFISFLEVNRQLKEFHIDFTFMSKPSDPNVNTLIETLKSLTWLKVHLMYNNHWKTAALEDTFQELKEMKGISVEGITLTHMKVNSESTFIEIIGELQPLKSLQTKFIGWEVETIIECVRIGKHLETISVGLYSEVTRKVIEDIATARELAVGNTNGPLEICFHGCSINNISDEAIMVRLMLAFFHYACVSSFLLSGFAATKNQTLCEERLCT